MLWHRMPRGALRSANADRSLSLSPGHVVDWNQEMSEGLDSGAGFAFLKTLWLQRIKAPETHTKARAMLGQHKLRWLTR